MVRVGDAPRVGSGVIRHNHAVGLYDPSGASVAGSLTHTVPRVTFRVLIVLIGDAVGMLDMVSEKLLHPCMEFEIIEVCSLLSA